MEDNFDNVESIDWALVAKRPEFVGHTQGSLRSLFSSMCNILKRKLNLDITEITLKHIAEYANLANGGENRKPPS